MGEFTNEEKERITQLYGNDFADATPDDYKLIARWEQAKAESAAKFEMENSLIREELEARKKLMLDQTQHALDTVNELKIAALERLKAVE